MIVFSILLSKIITDPELFFFVGTVVVCILVHPLIEDPVSRWLPGITNISPEPFKELL